MWIFRNKKAKSELLTLLFLLFGCAANVLWAQAPGGSAIAIDEAVPQADTTRITLKIAELDSLLQGVGDEKTIENAITQLFESLKDSISITYLVDKLGRIGIKNRQAYDFHHALFWHSQQKKYALKVSYPIGLVVALNNIGLLYRRMDHYAKSIEAYQLALRISDSINYLKGYTYATNGLGNLFLLLENYDDALRNFRECLRVEQKNNNLNGVALNLNNIGHVYLEQGKSEEALEYFMLSLEVNRELGNKRGIAICYSDIGEFYMGMGDTEKAMNYFMLSYQLNTSFNDLYYLSWNNLKIAEILLLAGKHREALTYVNEAQRLAEKTNNRQVLKDAYKYQYQINKAFGKTTQAIAYLEKATALNDSILNDNTQRVIFRMQATFNREQAEQKIQLLENQKQLADLKVKRQQMYNLIMVSGMLASMLLLTAVLFFLFYARKRNKQLKISNIEIEAGRNQLSEYSEQLLAAKQEAEQSNRLKSQFLANMSHEIRTPMNSVIGFSDILTKMIDDPVQLNYLQSIRASGQNLLTLINDILDLSKIEAGRFEIELMPMDYYSLLNDVQKIFELQCRERGIDMVIETEMQLPRFFHFGEGALRQIFVNLVGNAVKFTEQGTIKIFSRMINRHGNKAMLAIEVSDTGNGIPEHDIDFIFETFYQTQMGKTDNRGTGLGLTITKRLVEAMGGSILVKSTLGKGTVFSILFSDVLIGTGLSHLRHIIGENKPLYLAETCLLSSQNTIRAYVDKALEGSTINCDVYSDFDQLRENKQPNGYSLFILDVSQHENKNKFKIQNEEIILWLTTSNTEVATVSQSPDESFIHDVWPHFTVPDEVDKLAQHIYSCVAARQDPKTQSSEAVQLFSFPVNIQSENLIHTFLKAEQSYFIDDGKEFVVQLQQYAEHNSNHHLNSFIIALKHAIETFDIEEITNCYNYFRQQANIEDFRNTIFE